MAPRRARHGRRPPPAPPRPDLRGARGRPRRGAGRHVGGDRRAMAVGGASPPRRVPRRRDPRLEAGLGPRRRGRPSCRRGAGGPGPGPP
ncbi:MAG: hypothetical protein E6K17_01385, partial [Methanobacteriota archaeon]